MAKAKKLAEGLKRIGDKVVKKRMTAKERNEMSKPFKKMLSEGQKSKKGMSKKEFDARVKKGMAKDARIAKVKAENMAAATGPRKPKKLKDGSGKRGVFRKIGGAAKKAVQGAARGAYKKSIGAQANVLNKALNVIAPDSKITRAVSSIVDPKILGGKGGGPKTASKNTSPKPTKVKAKSAKGKVGKNRGDGAKGGGDIQLTMPGEDKAPKTRRMPSRMKKGGVAKKADGGMMSPQAMTPMRRRPPTPPMPPRSRVPKVRTEAIDPRLPRGKAGKGPLEPSDSTTRVPSQRKGIRKGLAGMLKKTMKAQAMNPPKLKKGPGMKDGGVAKKMGGGMMYKKNGGAVGSSKKGGGMAIRGLGKAFKNSKR